MNWSRVSTLDDATPEQRHRRLRRLGQDTAVLLDILSAPYGLTASEVRDTAIAVDILDDAGNAGRGFAHTTLF